MNPDFPIQRTVRRADTRFQLKFATEAKARIPAGEGFLLAPSRVGLDVLARNEDELSPPVETLREVYGASLEIGPPQVRFLTGVQVREPVMHVRISLDTADLDAVKGALRLRGAGLEEEYVRRLRAVLRYEAPLARLIGLPAELQRLTAGRVRYWIALSHYALVTGGPGGEAA